MMNNNVKTASNCCGVNGNDNGYDFVLGVLCDLGITACFDDYVVHIRQKYREESDWDYDNELLLAGDVRGAFEWLDDWWEGQPYVEVLGATRIYDLVIPDFETK